MANELDQEKLNCQGLLNDLEALKEEFDKIVEVNSRIPELEFHQKALEDERDRLNRRNEDLVGELKDAKRKLG